MRKSRNIYLELYLLANVLLLVFVAAQAMLLRKAFAGNFLPAQLTVAAVWLVVVVLLVMQLAFVLKLYNFRVPRGIFQTAWLLNSLLFPFILKLGAVLGYKNSRVMQSFVNMANSINCFNGTIEASKILVLLPHCIQNSDCRIRITVKPEACARCGRCKIGAMLELTEKYGVKFAVATGGTLARKIIRDTHPAVVLAVACERDLVSGLKDVFPLPAVGVLNKRPNGPCYNTDLDIDEVDRQLARLTGKEYGQQR